MLFTDFPITGELSFPLLIVKWIIAALSVELGLIFLIRYKKQSKRFKDIQNIGFSSLFFGFSTLRFFCIISDFYSPNIIISPFLFWNTGTNRDFYLGIGYIFLLIGVIIFTYFMEKNKKFIFFKFFFTLSFIILSIAVVIFFLVNLEIIISLTVSFWLIFLSLFVVNVIDFVKRIQEKKLKVEILKYLTPFLFFLIGFLLTSDFFISIITLEFRLISSIILLLSTSILFYFSLTLPSFIEFDWYDIIDEIFIMNKQGACLFHKTFKGDNKIMDEHLVTGAISTIKIMLDELISSEDKGLYTIKKEGKIVNIYSSTLLTCIFYTKEELNTINYYIQKVVTKLESIYKNVLIDWDGTLEVFSPIEFIVDELLSR